MTHEELLDKRQAALLKMEAAADLLREAYAEFPNWEIRLSRERLSDAIENITDLA